MVKMSNVCRIQYSKSCENFKIDKNLALHLNYQLVFSAPKIFLKNLATTLRPNLFVKLNRHGLRMYKYILTEVGKIHELFILF